MALVSELVTKVTADTKNFVSGMAKVAAAGAAAATAIVYAFDNITDRIDKLGKSAQKLGVDFDSFQSLKYAADIANVPIEKLEGGMVKLAKAVDEAAHGNKEATESFARLGLSAAELQNMTLDKQYATISEAIAKVTNKNEQLALSLKFFGKSGSEHLLLIRENASGLMKEFESLGLTITESQRAQSEAFQDTKTKMTTVFSGFGALVVSEVAPAFTILMDELTMSLTGMGNLKDAARSLASSLVSAVQFGVSGFDIFLTVLDQVRNRIDQIITGVGNAMQRVGMVHQFLVNAVSGAGISVDPSMIGKLNPIDTGPASSLGGNLSNTQSRLSDLSNSLNQPVMESFIQPINMAGKAATQFAEATVKATSQIGSMISSRASGQASARIEQLLSGSQNFNNTKPIYSDPQFEQKFLSIFDRVASSKIDENEFNMAIEDLTSRASYNRNGDFNALPNIAAVEDLKRFSTEKGFLGAPKQKAELKVFVKADKGFVTEFSDQPAFGDAVGKWLEIITEASN